MSAKLIKAGALVFIITTVSKVLGFLRETFVAYYFGTSFESDAFYVALTPATLGITFSLSLSSVFLPLFVKYLDKKEDAYEFTNKIVQYFFLATLLIYMFVFFKGESFVAFIAPGLPDHAENLSIDMLKILFPLTFFVIVIQLYTVMLNSLDSYVLPALSVLPSNLLIIVYLLLFGKSFGIESIAYITFIGFAVQFIMLYFFLKKYDYRLKPAMQFWDFRSKEFMLLLLPILVSTFFSQLNAVVDRLLASTLQEGSISALMYSFRLRTVIMGIFVTGIITVTFPKISRLTTKVQTKELVKLTQDSLLAVLFLVGPVSLFFILFSNQIIEVLFERGAFDKEATIATAGVFFYYSIGLLFTACREIIMRNFFAFGDTKTPIKIIIYSLVINMGLSVVLVKMMGLSGLGISSSIAMFISAIHMGKKLTTKMPNIWSSMFIKTSMKIVLALTISSVMIYVFSTLDLFSWQLLSNVVLKLLILTLFFLVYITLFTLLLVLLKVEVVSDIYKKLMKKIKGVGGKR
ncbi:MAG: murein biosynthesis integral membrane protein MurJ [Bacillota bacterium]